MDNDFTEIEEHPSRVNSALAAASGDVFFAQRLVDLIANGSNLAFAVAATEDKVIGKGAHSSEV